VVPNFSVAKAESVETRTPRNISNTTDFEVIEKGTSHIHVGHFGDPVVHLDVDVGIYKM
jgi:hypothetical protein